MNVKPVHNTIFGGFGFIGSHLCKNLEKDGLRYQIVGRKDPMPTGNLGNIYYCAGITADFRSRPFDTIDAHISTLSNILERGQYSTFLYLSSARIYRHATLTTEDAKFSINPFEPEDLVDISKLAGESYVRFLIFAVFHPPPRHRVLGAGSNDGLEKL